MSDIKALIERLRNDRYWPGAPAEAADALEALQAERDEAVKKLGDVSARSLFIRVQKANTERDEARQHRDFLLEQCGEAIVRAHVAAQRAILNNEKEKS